MPHLQPVDDPAPEHGTNPSKLPVIARIDGWGINVRSMPDAIASITRAASQQKPCALFTLNLDHLVKLRSNKRFREAYEQACYVTADGAPIVWLARAQAGTVERTTGADIVLPLADAATRFNLPIFLFGSKASTLGKAAMRLAMNAEGKLDICGTESPPMDFDPDSEEADAAIDRIVQSGARICLVALGAPKQEIFASRAIARGAPVTFVCVGAALDFLAGAQTRAPRVMQRNGLEWLWRLVTNPRRLTARYAQCAWLFLKLFTAAPASQRELPG